MNHKIKFKVWDHTIKRWLNRPEDHMLRYLLDQNGDLYYREGDRCADEEEKDKEAVFATGEKINNIDAYVGDIIRITDEEGEHTFCVILSEKGYCVKYDFIDFASAPISFAIIWWNSRECKYDIVGNIYETPNFKYI